MTREYQANLALYIDGSWCSGEGRDVHQVLNPATGEVQAKTPLASTAEMRAAVEAALKAFPEWSAQNPQKRARVMFKFKELVEKEDTKDPLSDDKLAELLEEKHGVKIARRTITKYRKALGIASSTQRKVF